MATANARDIVIGIESFGDDDAPLVLIVGGTTMLSWPDALCERLAAGGRRVVRYDLRDSGESTTAYPEAPAYTLRDLAADAAALAAKFGGRPAHLAGIGVGRMVAQLAMLDHPAAFSALTLAGTRAVAPGPPDDDPFSPLDCTPRWRERLTEVEAPTLVVHGPREPFPVGNGEGIAREIPCARLLVLEQAATTIPDAATGEVAKAMLALG